MRRSALALLLAAAACAPSGGPPRRVLIPAGSSVRAVADSLAAHDLIASTAWFRLRARLSGDDRRLKPGLYEFTPGSGIGAMLRALAAGDAIRLTVTLPEGGTLHDLARSAEQKLGIPRAALLAAAADSALRREFDIPGATVEGYLLPETFDFGGETAAPALLRRFLEARRATWDSTWDARSAATGLTRDALLTLASIVEAEALLPEDRPLVAAVYRNRLRIGMALQADPTIQYGYLLRDGARKGRLYNSDYAFDSPWNSYLHPGLPPGPIGNPAREAIEAVLSPPAVPYLYFVAGTNGKHVFSRSYQDHLRAIRRIRVD